MNAERGSFDWVHINSATYVGPNRWFDEGDRRFAPNNIIISSRQAGFVAIVGRDGKIAWRIGPDFLESKELTAIRQIIGQHHPHIIPKGLPGAGNLMVFDNGGSSGYGAPTPVSPDGSAIHQRAGSRVLEINPKTLELVWSYTGPRFFSTNISGAQRLPNGNTLITEGAPGRLLEVTSDRRIVWEVHLSGLRRRERVERRVSRLSGAVRLDSADCTAGRARGRAAANRGLPRALTLQGFTRSMPLAAITASLAADVSRARKSRAAWDAAFDVAPAITM